MSVPTNPGQTDPIDFQPGKEYLLLTMKITIPLDITAVLKQLPLSQKVQLVRELEQETWGVQLDNVVNRIRTRPSVRRLSAKEVTEIVEDVRKARYARRSGRP